MWVTLECTNEHTLTHAHDALYPPPLGFYPISSCLAFQCLWVSESRVQIQTSSAVWLQAKLHVIVD